ncbi:MAG: cadherin-like domain-containing protein [Stenotrophomonas sp.]|uniref:cadherin-like domain-containing protein n=1 Tax=Stenotrophomonas sp. TaxID=69392 RepID=UPI003D6D4795
MEITANGTIFIAGSDPGKTPAGAPGCVATSDNSIPPGPFLAPGLTCWALIGRVGNGSPFDVGTGINFSASGAGQLFLGVNDNFFGDNSGSWGATITVTPATTNSAPMAADDAYTTDEDAPLTVPDPGVLANDTDPDTDPLTATLVTGPTHGTLTLNPKGSFTYTPAPNFNGTDTFTYKANDGPADSNTATVTLTINPTNDAPVAADDAYKTSVVKSLPVLKPLKVKAPGVLGNDTDLDGDALTAMLVTGPTHGTLTLNANGSFTYKPNLLFVGTDTFTYKANDGTATSNVATVKIKVSLS